MIVNKIWKIITVVLIICANMYALYAGFFICIFSFLTLREGETIDYPLLVFYVIVSINIIYITIRLILKLINICKALKRNHQFN